MRGGRGRGGEREDASRLRLRGNRDREESRNEAIRLENEAQLTFDIPF